jgi:hypothetical protein
MTNAVSVVADRATMSDTTASTSACRCMLLKSGWTRNGTGYGLFPPRFDALPVLRHAHGSYQKVAFYTHHHLVNIQ